MPQRIPRAASPTGSQCTSVPHGTATGDGLAREHGGKTMARPGGVCSPRAHALGVVLPPAPSANRHRAQTAVKTTSAVQAGRQQGRLPWGLLARVTPWVWLSPGDSAGARAAYARRVPGPMARRGLRLGRAMALRGLRSIALRGLRAGTL